jgi:hypothetical protein
MLVLALTLGVGGLVAAPAQAKAGSYAPYYPRYRYEYRYVWVQVAYTKYDYYGNSYTAYKWVRVRKLVKVYY